MGIFGQLDAANIPSNPFFVEAGEYSAQVTKALFKNNRDGERQLVIEYTIDDENSQYLDSKLSDYFTLVEADMTQEKFDTLPADDQKDIRRRLSNLKRRLCGSDSNTSQKGLGVPVEDLNDPEWNPESLMGTKVEIAVSNYGPNNTGVNIKWVNLASE